MRNIRRDYGNGIFARPAKFACLFARKCEIFAVAANISHWPESPTIFPPILIHILFFSSTFFFFFFFFLISRKLEYSLKIFKFPRILPCLDYVSVYGVFLEFKRKRTFVIVIFAPDLNDLQEKHRKILWTILEIKILHLEKHKRQFLFYAGYFIQTII